MDLARLFGRFTHRDWQQVVDGRVQLAMIGLGWWTRERAIPAIEQSELCETSVLVSGDQRKARTIAKGSNTIQRSISYDEFHEGEGADNYEAVYVSTPNALHLPFVSSAARHGKHVLCEKPMETTVARAESMIDVCDREGVLLMICYRMQTEPAIRRTRDLVRSGFIGEPAYVHGHMSQRLLEMIPEPTQWRLNPELVGPGTSVTDLGIYPINTARFVLESDPVWVTAHTESEASPFANVPDERATFEMRFDNGVLAICSASQNAYRSGRFEVIGSDGRLGLEPAFIAHDRRRLVVERDGTAATISFDSVDQMTEVFDYFADRILDNGRIEPDGRHALVDMRTIESIYQSARYEQRVTLH